MLRWTNFFQRGARSRRGTPKLLLIITIGLSGYLLSPGLAKSVGQAASLYRDHFAGRHTAQFAPFDLESREGQATPIPPQTLWFFECVECPKLFDSLDMVVNPAGDPHVAYGKDHLYYAWNDGERWHYETADPSPGAGSHASLALAQNGAAHISYYDSLNGDLKYAYQDPLGWHTMVVDDLDNVGSRSSLALDAAGQPKITYYDAFNGDLKYAYQDSQGWHIETVDSLGSVGSDNALALDAAGNPHISYRDYSHGLKYASKTAQGWQIEIVDDEGGMASSLALSPDGAAHISYIFSECFLYLCNGELRYAHRDASGWHSMSITTLDSGSSTSLALDANGDPHISYTIYIEPCFICDYPGTSAVQYAYRDQNGWELATADSEWSSTGLDIAALALNPADMPLIGYLIGSHDLLKVASLQNGGGWVTEAIDTHQDVGVYNSVGLDDLEKPHIAFLDSTNKDLYYAEKGVNGWQAEYVAHLSSYYGSTNFSYSLDSSNTPHIVYADGTNSGRQNPGSSWIDYLYKGAGWISERIVYYDGELRYSFPALAVDRTNLLHLIYFDQFLGSLVYAYRDQGGWQSEPVVSEPARVRATLAVDSLGFPHLGYVDPAGDLRYGYKDGQGWHLANLAAGVTADISIALDSQDRAHISYQLGTDNALFHTYQDTSGWQTEFVDFGGSDSMSLVIDSGDRPHLIYVRDGEVYGQFALTYAYQDSLGWHSEVLISESHTGMATLVLDENDSPKISYYDSLTGDLLYARLIEVSEFVHLPLVPRR